MGSMEPVTEAINGIKYSEGFNGADGAKLRSPFVQTHMGGSKQVSKVLVELEVV